jgi:hypothetical protein
MGTVIRILVAAWFFMIFGFCVYGFLVTYLMPGETFCRAMYTAMIALCTTNLENLVRRTRISNPFRSDVFGSNFTPLRSTSPRQRPALPGSP